jgi:BRCA1-associated protein
LDALTLEFSFLLTSQLESQRHYFEERIAIYEQEHRDSIKKLDQETLSLWNDYRVLQKDRDEARRELLTERKEKKNSEKKLALLQARITKLESELDEERQLNMNLMENQMKSKAAESGKEKQITDLLEQIQDLTFTLETIDRIEKSPRKKEIQEGSIIIQPSTSTASSQSKCFTTGHRKRK